MCHLRDHLRRPRRALRAQGEEARHKGGRRPLNVPSDETFERFHRIRKQHAELETLERRAATIIGEAPTLEAAIMSEFVKRAQAYISQFVDLTLTTLPSLEVKLRPAAVSGKDFMVAMPASSLISMAQYGFLSRMKSALESEKKTPLYEAFETTVPAEDIGNALVVGAVAEGKDPYVNIAANPQRVIRLMKGAEPFDFDSLLVSDDTVTIKPLIRRLGEELKLEAERP